MGRWSVLSLVWVCGCARAMDPAGAKRDAVAVDAVDAVDAGEVDLAVRVDGAADLALPPDLASRSCSFGSPNDGGGGGELVLAGVAAGALQAARFAPGTGWSSFITGGGLAAEVTLTTVGAPPTALALVRQPDDTLTSARFDDCTGEFAALA